MSQYVGLQQAVFERQDASMAISFALAKACKAMLGSPAYDRGQFVLKDDELRRVLESCERQLSGLRAEFELANVKAQHDES
jgi:hypothetical protein